MNLRRRLDTHQRRRVPVSGIKKLNESMDRLRLEIGEIEN